MLSARLRASLQSAKNDNARSADYDILPGRQEHSVLSSRKKRILRQASSDDHEGPHESLGNEIENAQFNHLTPLSSAVAPPVLKRRQNGKMGEERGIEK